VIDMMNCSSVAESAKASYEVQVLLPELDPAHPMGSSVTLTGGSLVFILASTLCQFSVVR
jgi:hypothetical protein